MALALAAPCGLALGSFAVTAGIRGARREGAVSGRSRCDACGGPLGFAETVPVASYVALRGACAHCGSRIDPLHTAGEVSGALVLVAAPWDVSLWAGALASIAGLLLLAASAVDAKSQRLPDVLTAAIAVVALAMAARHGVFGVAQGAIAAAATGAVLLAVATWVGRRRGETALGLGDVKLACALALWLGPATPLMMLAACAVALAAAPFLRDGRGRIPFGPMIAAGGWSVGVILEHGWLRWAL